MPESETTYITYTLGVDVDPANADAIVAAARRLNDHDEPLTVKNAIAVLVNHGEMGALAGAGHRGGWECHPADGWDTQPVAGNTDSVKSPTDRWYLTYDEIEAVLSRPNEPEPDPALVELFNRPSRLDPPAKPAVVIITDDAEVEIHPTPDVDVFVYPAGETADDLRRDADTLEARGLIEAARTLRRMAAGET